MATKKQETPGAASRMIDRLEDAGCVTRVPDAHDRRRILIEPTDEGLDRVAAHYAGLTARIHEDLSAFDDDQLRTLPRFVELSRASAIREIHRLRFRGRRARSSGVPGRFERVRMGCTHTISGSV